MVFILSKDKEKLVCLADMLSVEVSEKQCEFEVTLTLNFKEDKVVLGNYLNRSTAVSIIEGIRKALYDEEHTYEMPSGD